MKAFVDVLFLLSSCLEPALLQDLKVVIAQAVVQVVGGATSAVALHVRGDIPHCYCSEVFLRYHFIDARIGRVCSRQPAVFRAVSHGCGAISLGLDW